jgi:cytochrome c553
MLRFFLISTFLLATAPAELIGTFRQGAETDVRIDRMAALSLAPGKPPTPFLNAGKFEVVWTGTIDLTERRRLYFSFGGNGMATLMIDGKKVLTEEGELGKEKSKRLRLNSGSHDISVGYASEENGGASFRLYWQEENLPRQTIPPTAYQTTISEEAKLGELKRHGRLAFTRQNCAKCHVPEGGFGSAPMPEATEIAPIVVGIGNRVTEDWLRKWIADPKALKPNTHMPHFIDPKTPEGRQQAADIAAFLPINKTAGEAVIAPDPELAKTGGVHFHELGCIACHHLPGDEATDQIPLNNVASKYLPGQLIEFLKRPEAYHPFTAMPNFNLSDDETASLAAFLTAQSTGKETQLAYDFPAGDAARGAAVAESMHCGTCHPGLPGAVAKAPSLDMIFKADWAVKGCLAEGGKRPELPIMNLKEGDMDSLLAFSKTGFDSLKKDNEAEFAERQISEKRCTACHAMDGDASLLDALHTKTAGLAAHVKALNERVDQTRPQLTFVGEMLFTDYIESMLTGNIAQGPRPWLGTRMPAFSVHAKTLAAGLSRIHGFDPSGSLDVKTDPALIEIGKSLVGAEGFGCTTCHGIGDQKPTAAFEVGAVNFQLIPERLREDYYHRWMENPASVTPGSKMPRYAEGNQSQRGDILEGDATKQYEAIWNWIHAE